MTAKIDNYLEQNNPATPCVVVDLERVETNYRSMTELAPWAEIFYAVKANPAMPVLSSLSDAGCSFDAASIAEIEACLEAGVSPERISYGNTVKKSADIAAAAAKGIGLFAFDSLGEVEKLAAFAPGAKVFCRIVVANDGARWPLTRKFGCAPDEAAPLLLAAKQAGLVPAGLSFHVGSQQTESERWLEGISRCADLFEQLAAEGVSLELINLGGGFPVPYRNDDGPELHEVFDSISRALNEVFDNKLPRILIEPGRAVVATAGKLRSEVILVTERIYGGRQLWVYLDVGRYGGLAETEGEAIQYRLEFQGQPDAFASAVIAGPTCDSHDVLYEDASYDVPTDLKAGDLVTFQNTGAYTSTYASIGFNGFAPLAEYFV
ncbi:MAG: type III PLP-dependent enzyme [Alphaproteobacteria bacterium]|jgi:ornithine decarboxylase|nr:type III PLP-dependent enzyme [Alphaproteobacteria bacterium]